VLLTSSPVRYWGFNPYLTSSELSVHPAQYQISEDRGITSTIAARLKGRKLFHVRYIRWSYRIRGSAARIHTKIVARIMVLEINIKLRVRVSGMIIPVKNTTEISLIIRIFAYSAIKIMANRALLYSILNPDTSSDSPSAKSNGVRFVSARFVMNQVINRGIIINIFQDRVFKVIVDISSCLYIISALSKIIDIVTSYEIV
jgi:hypothetical protein